MSIIKVDYGELGGGGSLSYTQETQADNSTEQYSISNGVIVAHGKDSANLYRAQFLGYFENGTMQEVLKGGYATTSYSGGELSLTLYGGSGYGDGWYVEVFKIN